MLPNESQMHDLQVQPQITSNDIKVLDDLLTRTENLPEILHLRAADWGYVLTDQDKGLLFDTYQKLDDILKEVAALINIRFPGCHRHLRAWHDIDFDTKIGPLKVVTNDREHIKREWRKGMFDLKSLIKILRNEALLLIKQEHIVSITESTSQVSQLNPVGSSWLEKASWIAGIVGTLIAVYLLLATLF